MAPIHCRPESGAVRAVAHARARKSGDNKSKRRGRIGPIDRSQQRGLSKFIQHKHRKETLKLPSSSSEFVLVALRTLIWKSRAPEEHQS